MSVVTLPTRPALRHVLAQLDRDIPSPEALTQARQMLRHIGRRFVDFADVMVGDRADPLLEPDHPIAYGSLLELYRRYEQEIPVARMLWLNDCLARLKRGQQATIDDRRQIADIRARLRVPTAQ